MKKIGILLLLSFCSCITIKGQLKGLYSYFDKTNRLYPGLLLNPGSETLVCGIEPTEQPKIVIVNGKQIKDCIAQSENAVFYFWSPLCTSEYCYAVDVVQRECTKKKLDLYVVAEYYDGNKMNMNYKTDHPIFGIDTKYYDSSVCDNYVPKFLKDLTGDKMRNVKFLKFKNGSIIHTFYRIEEL